MNTKNLIQLARQINAEDLTGVDHVRIVNIVGAEHGMSVMQTSSGSNGICAALVKGNTTGKFYYVTKRNSNLFVIL